MVFLKCFIEHQPGQTVSLNLSFVLESCSLICTAIIFRTSGHTVNTFDSLFSETSSKSVKVELVISSSIDPGDIETYYSQEQHLLEEGAKRNSFEGFKLYNRKVQMESLGNHFFFFLFLLVYLFAYCLFVYLSVCLSVCLFVFVCFIVCLFVTLFLCCLVI